MMFIATKELSRNKLVKVISLMAPKHGVQQFI
jgi:hypothetical protein